MIKTIHVGVAGRGIWPLDCMRSDPRFKPVALVDTVPAHLEAALKYAPEAKTYTDLAAALRETKADAAILCTPTRTHAPLSRLCFAAGLHVLVEKGMTMSYDEAVALVADGDKAKVKFCVAQNYRYRANELLVSKLLADASSPHHIGAPLLVDYIHHRYRPEPRTLDYPYAMVWDMACHHVDSLSCWLGPVARVTAVSSNPPWSKYKDDADIHAVLEYRSGAVCHYALTHAATYAEWKILLQGEHGALLTGDRDVTFFPKPAGQLGGSPGTKLDIPDTGGSEANVLSAFHAYLDQSIEPGISGKNNLHTLAVCELLVRSAKARRPVEATEL